ncbi:MAG TPA: tRNA 2-thiouridine(34) synthase MnmA [Candidatus Paceibacterota bacterium]
MKELKNKKLVCVAMSGGVDSSVAAALLKKQGLDIVGVFMKPWSPNLSTTTLNVVTGSVVDNCPWKEDREDAMRAASVLGIRFETWDFSKEYKKSVTDYMVKEYRAGRTPNPDVMCNKEIKFGLFFDRAMKEGADYIATGHYVRVKQGRLFTAKDKNKDQSYFLWTLKQKQLEKCLFPIGDYIKPEVRKLAKKFGLSNHDKKDSQGVCFIGPLNVKDFLQTKIKTKTGNILHLDGRILGKHDGIYYYTIGQRHGLNMSIGGGPYYIVSKNVKKNIIYVGSNKNLLSKKMKLININWINSTDQTGQPVDNRLRKSVINREFEVDVRVRYRAELKKAVLKKSGELELKTPERAITSGQSAVFYKKGELLGGGVIE